MKNNPKEDLYLYGRFCDYYLESKQVMSSLRKKEAYKRLSKYYRVPISVLKILVKKKKDEVGGSFIEP